MRVIIEEPCEHGKMRPHYLGLHISSWPEDCPGGSRREVPIIQPDYEALHKVVFDSIMAYNHPSISVLDAEFLGDEILGGLGLERGAEHQSALLIRVEEP